MLAVKVKDLVKKYNDRVVLNKVSFNVKKGEILGIVGRSGAGKSTLIKILRGSLDYDEGEVEILGRKENFKEVTAIHLQRNFALWAEPVINNVIRKLYAIKNNADESLPIEEEWEEYEREAIEILKLVGLEHKKDAFANILSGGEKQRLILARQITKLYLKREGVLLLDEPGTMACPASKQKLLDAIKNIRDKLEITVILTSHLPDVHEYLCDRAILLENGKVKMDGEVGEVLKEFLKDMKEPYKRKPNIKDKKIIEVKNVSKRYYVVHGGETLNLKNISFYVREGEIVSIIGPSGVGKTVLIRLMAGLELPDEGEIIVDGVNLKNFGWERVELRKRIGIMHQEFSLPYYQTVENLLKYRLGLKGEKAIAHAKALAKELNLSEKIVDSLYQLIDLPESERISKLQKLGLSEEIIYKLFPPIVEDFNPEDILEALDLSKEILKKKVSELSGGEKVRVAIALELITKPKILFLDEPFGDLDPITLRDVANYLKKINEKFGTTIVLVSHHIDFIKEISDRAILLDRSEVKEGKPEEICEEFIKKSEAKFMS
ncbi:ABC transporter related protein [Methanocaldococcus infernus ME]|uniref:ABC transporter related protein n=1 Tax=Methanocaldococcus infernus (strain DSM 11812 / JCM 15783 / ME) TaxID=573063 RepID=D5VRK4_METIM|nr:ATP-binding cassette domain-containing protein [Methanocaldococcus infernus]ADG13207.1 ABC transporter related protein [Methanocaldococcus infernus ME]